MTVAERLDAIEAKHASRPGSFTGRPYCIAGCGTAYPCDTLALVAALRAVLDRHKPLGAYLPVGQLDGDCSCGSGAYPCATVRAIEAADNAE